MMSPNQKKEETFAMISTPDTLNKEEYNQFFFYNSQEIEIPSMSNTVIFKDNSIISPSDDNQCTLLQTAEFNKFLITSQTKENNGK